MLLACYPLGVPPIVFLNYAWLSLDTGIPRDTVQRCIQETLRFLSYTLAKKQGVDFIFKDIGCLVFRKNKVQMQFSNDFVHSLNSNGQLLKSRLSVSFSLHPHSPGFLGNAREATGRDSSCWVRLLS